MAYRRNFAKENNELNQLNFNTDTETKEDSLLLNSNEFKNKHQSPYTVENSCWIILSIAVFYYVEFPKVVLYDERPYRTWLLLSWALFGTAASIAAFLIGYVSLFKKIDSSQWEDKYPVLIPIATASLVLGSISLNISLWPVWHIFTPVILFVICIGFVVFVAMIPHFSDSAKLNTSSKQ